MIHRRGEMLQETKDKGKDLAPWTPKDVATLADLRRFLETYFHRTGQKVRVFLFGSRARGTHAPGSDVDLAIEGVESDSGEITQLQAFLEESMLPQKVDLVLLSQLPESIQEEVRREGKLWIDLTK